LSASDSTVSECDVGAALSNIIAGWIVVAAGYDAAFISLGVFAAAGLAV
jgi:hypothetical protein